MPTRQATEAFEAARRPVAIEKPVMRHRWSEVGFLHWRYHPADVKRLLPEDVIVDTNDGAAWVTLLPFHLEVWTPNKRLGTGFLETNVRTYVRGPDGVPGIVFLSLDAERLDGVLLARTTYGLPYRRAAMGFEAEGCRRRYWTRRTWPGHPATGMNAAIEIGEQTTPASTAGVERFLTARFAFYNRRHGQLFRGWAEHPPWVLHHAAVMSIDQTMLEAAGLPAPGRPPDLAHWSPGTDVAFGRVAMVGP